MTIVITPGSFDDLRSRQVRLLEEAAKLGELQVLLWSDEVARRLEGKALKFPEAERQYLVDAVRYVNRVALVTELDSPEDLKGLPGIPAGVGASVAGNVSGPPITWAVDETDDTPAKRAFCAARGLTYRVFTTSDLAGFPGGWDQGAGGRDRVPAGRSQEAAADGPSPVAGRPSVLVTGCYDWLHSGHVRFFEEVSELGDLYVAVGNDANVRHLKGAGHPLQSQEERCYMVGAIRYVTQALLTSGHGWMDAEPEIERLRPDMYAVNEDGDVPEKRAFCQAHGLTYVVLKRTPKAGLSKRSSTELRGF